MKIADSKRADGEGAIVVPYGCTEVIQGAICILVERVDKETLICIDKALGPLQFNTPQHLHKNLTVCLLVLSLQHN
jgi:hypothetical protein